VRLGAACVHLHPRGDDGREVLDPEVVDAACVAVRGAAAVPVGVTTGAWVEPDVGRRRDLVRHWTAPDYASVNLAEDGAVDLVRLLLEVGIGVEAGIGSVEDADLLVRSGLGGEVTRVLVEPTGLTPARALVVVGEIHAVLDRATAMAPRLQHGDGDPTWRLLADALARGLDTRIGLEDTTVLPDGSVAADNAALVGAAVELALTPGQ
jgi:uncharacterized protein (DUF849 family)